MYVIINDTKVGFKKFGSGDPILIVHGWGGSSESLSTLGRLIKDHSVYLIDLPGFGISSDPPKNWGVKEYAEIVKDFIQKLELTGCTYIGHSFGGGIGILMASEYPGVISKLILLAPAYHREPIESSVSKKVNKIIPFYKNIKGLLKGPRKLYYRIFHPMSDAMKDPHLENVYRNIISSDLREYVKNIDIPTLLLWGKKDVHTPETDSLFLVKNIKNIEYHSFRSYSHGFPLKYPEKIVPLIYQFVEKWK